MVTRIRKIYNGKIVYGPNWSNEFSKLTFWKYFDYIGLSEYFPISDKNNPTDEELFQGAESVMKEIHSVQKKYNKPIIFTEVGFRSTGEPWKTALENKTKNETNLQNQARCYNALLKAAYHKKWLAGMYWWKWPSYLSFGGSPANEHYTPNNKPAEEVVKKWYSKSWN
jgi:exo-beta-1,3-glucanase (GH17 family)